MNLLKTCLVWWSDNYLILKKYYLFKNASLRKRLAFLFAQNLLATQKKWWKQAKRNSPQLICAGGQKAYPTIIKDSFNIYMNVFSRCDLKWSARIIRVSNLASIPSPSNPSLRTAESKKRRRTPSAPSAAPSEGGSYAATAREIKLELIYNRPFSIGNINNLTDVFRVKHKGWNHFALIRFHKARFLKG